MTAEHPESAPAKGFKLTVTRVIQAPCALAFRAWTDLDQLMRWYGPADVQLKSFIGEIKVGGSYRIHMVSPRGDHVAYGKYREITLNKRLQFTWHWEKYEMPASVVTVEFEDLGKSTRLTLVHEGLPDQEDVDQHTHGWNSVVAQFAQWIEPNKS